MINPLDIMKQTEQAYHLKHGSLIKHKRTKTIAEARAVAMYLMRCINNYSFMEIADYFDRDHSTVMHNCKKIVNILQEGYNNNTQCTIMKLIDNFNSIKRGV